MATAKDPDGRGRRTTALLLLPTSMWFLLLLVMPLIVVLVFSLGERAPAGGTSWP